MVSGDPRFYCILLPKGLGYLCIPPIILKIFVGFWGPPFVLKFRIKNIGVALPQSLHILYVLSSFVVVLFRIFAGICKDLIKYFSFFSFSLAFSGV